VARTAFGQQNDVRMSALRDALSRRRQELNPLATTIPFGQQPFQHTPISAISITSPSGYYGAPYNTPVTAVREYNPQQWGPAAIGPEHAVRYSPAPAPADDIEGMFGWATVF
jgi:hypothetical protein